MATIPPPEHERVLIVDREEVQEAILIRPTGEVGLTSVPRLWSNLKALVEDGQNVVVDLSAIQSIDSAGVEALVDAGHLFLQRGQRFVLAKPTSVVQRLIDIVCLDKVIPIFASLEDALDSFHVAHASTKRDQSTPSITSRQLVDKRRGTIGGAGTELR